MSNYEEGNQQAEKEKHLPLEYVIRLAKHRKDGW